MQWACAALSSVACPPALQNFPTLSHKRHDFRIKLLDTKCVFWFSLQLLSEIIFILKRIERDMIKMYIGLHVKYPLFLSDFNETWISSTDFRKLLKYQISWKSDQWEPSCSLRTDRREDMTKLTVAFGKVAKASNNNQSVPHREQSVFPIEKPTCKWCRRK
jgi:hypothetical protein